MVLRLGRGGILTSTVYPAHAAGRCCMAGVTCGGWYNRPKRHDWDDEKFEGINRHRTPIL